MVVHLQHTHPADGAVVAAGGLRPAALLAVSPLLSAAIAATAATIFIHVVVIGGGVPGICPHRCDVVIDDIGNQIQP